MRANGFPLLRNGSSTLSSTACAEAAGPLRNGKDRWVLKVTKTFDAESGRPPACRSQTQRISMPVSKTLEMQVIGIAGTCRGCSTQ